MGQFPIAEAQLAALFMQSVAYGIHVVTFAACMYTWFQSSHNARISGTRLSGRWLWMFVSITFFVVGTCDLSFNFYHNLIAFIFYTGPGGANAEFNRFTNWVNLMRNIFFYINNAVSDAALIYRCWHVYAHSRQRAIVAIAPLVVWFGWLSITVVLLYYAVTLDNATSIPGTRKIQPFIYAYYATTLAINLFSTGLIILRLWTFHRRTAQFFTQSWRAPGRLDLVQIILIFVESALLYTATVIVCIALDLVGSNAYYGATDISLEAAGISFDLIIIRVWKGVSTEQTQAFADTVQRISKVKGVAQDEQVNISPPSLTNADLALSRDDKGVTDDLGGDYCEKFV